ncbi:hypothetical protein SKAU_G00047040 [Synaphobranchus kaupii]|uniref:PDZ domain-containing protein n=1 Tax=Synaphobranchus kaupii TaxID=118154 RepID=A0A9Q1G3A5_SYNKA|nr:hypothetical protein SKAU_G00047040 [Synaphobranchus kaupii]
MATLRKRGWWTFARRPTSRSSTSWPSPSSAPPLPHCRTSVPSCCLTAVTHCRPWSRNSTKAQSTSLTPPASGERADEFEYEEVELCRLNSQEKLGLTLCYRTDEEEDVGIYVSEVGPNSIAARDGRIREGDRILQINGQDVQNREEVVTALSNEECQNILLLVARPELQLDEGWLDDEQSQFLEELKMEMLEEQRKEEVEHTSSREEQHKGCEEEEEEDEITTDTATCSSNNRYQAGDPDHSSESPEREAPAHVQTRPIWGRQVRLGGDPSQDRNRASGERPDQRCATPREEEEGEEGHDHFRQHLEVKCQIGGEYDLYYSRRSTVECSLTEQEGVQRELRLLNEELKSIERECQNIMQARQLRLTRDPSKDPGPDGAAKPANVPGLPERSDKDSSSAYNTAESSRSTPLATRRSPDRSLQRAVSTANQKNLLRTAAGQSPQAAVPAKPGPEAPPPVPYLSPDRHANIPAHARHYQSYMHLIQQRAAVEVGQSQLSLVSVCKDLQPRGATETRAEWKVKLRADGSRYVARRPARDRLLRERALKIREERGGGTTTTDDDAASELKLGRYWSKEERKQHLLRAKEQRRRREFMMRSRLESLRESPQSGGEGGRKEVSILELSHRKMMKKRNRKILDNWMTIQELMSHGARTPEDTGVHSAFLSVTTGESRQGNRQRRDHS